MRLAITIGITIAGIIHAGELDEIKSILDKNYVRDINQAELERAAVKGIISSLDPHSNYIEKEDFKEFFEMMNDSYVGIGIEITISKGYPIVLGVNRDSPAEKSGIKAGDIITAADDKKLYGLPIKDVGNTIKGKVGSYVDLKVIRDGNEREFKVLREKIKVVSSYVKLVGDVAYIKIRNFSKDIANSVRKAYDSLDKSKITGVIVDLRYNPGGLLEEAVNVSSLFLNGESKVLSIKGRNNKKDFFSSGSDITKGIPIVVIINSTSASASEIVAAALQENKRAQVVGTKSFGKGSVQATFKLTHGDVIKLTTALYYTPLGKAIQGNGVEPDIVVEDEMALEKVPFLDQFSENSLKNKLPDDLFEKTKEIEKVQLYRTKVVGDTEHDFQLMRAIDVIRTMNFYR